MSSKVLFDMYYFSTATLGVVSITAFAETLLIDHGFKNLIGQGGEYTLVTKGAHFPLALVHYHKVLW
jgi:hypothetical protein